MLLALQTQMNNAAMWVAARRAQLLGVFVTLVMALAVQVKQMLAQTPVPITIDTNALFTQVNNWTTSLDDVIFVGVAISIALAILTFIGAQIIKAFRGGSGVR
ncbi:MAG: hypothetical protein IPK17_01555 [Chloroflexi bacterium]|uniref:hypothetical protein n=1 Tax=Candidatus Flexifilum breve TaxID=3140694 RepID=UPI00313519FF|nr:hypothetical protein [Chloroflexota bacterium]